MLGWMNVFPSDVPGVLQGFMEPLLSSEVKDTATEALKSVSKQVSAPSWFQPLSCSILSIDFVVYMC